VNSEALLEGPLSEHHGQSPDVFAVACVGSLSVMAALVAGCARNLRPHWCAYAQATKLLEITKVPYLQHYDDPRCLDKET